MDREQKLFLARQTQRAVQLFAGSLSLTETESMEIADLYEPWTVGKAYAVGKILKHGQNTYGETQLYSVITAHTSQADWPPQQTPSLFKAIGFTADGVSVWTQPFGYQDAYDLGDVVEHPQGSGTLWKCTEGNAGGEQGPRNTYAPGIWGWVETT